MEIIVFTISSEERSARRLGYRTETYLNGYTEDYDNSIIIRWGNSSILYGKDGKSKEFKNVLNVSVAIQLNCAKDKALAKMGEVVTTPKMWKAGEIVPENELVVSRCVNHSSGYDFKVVKGGFEVEDGDYATKYIRTNLEIRAWFCGNEIMCSERIPNKNYIKTKFPCRSMYSYRFIKVPKGLKEQVIKAKEAISLDCGASDILVKNNKYYFIEKNSASTIDFLKIERFYVNALKKLIKVKFGVDK